MAQLEWATHYGSERKETCLLLILSNVFLIKPSISLFWGHSWDPYQIISPPAAETESTRRLSMRKRRLSIKRPWASAASWLRRRRNAVKTAVSAGPTAAQGRDVGKMASKLWGAQHDKEKEHNVKKERSKRILDLFN